MSHTAYYYTRGLLSEEELHGGQFIPIMSGSGLMQTASMPVGRSRRKQASVQTEVMTIEVGTSSGAEMRLTGEFQRGEPHAPQRLSGPGTKAIELRELGTQVYSSTHGLECVYVTAANLQRLYLRRGASNDQVWTDLHLELQISYLFVNLFARRFVKAVPELHRSESGNIGDGAYGYAGRAGI